MTKPKHRPDPERDPVPLEVLGHPNDVEPAAWAGHASHAGPALEGPSVADLIAARRELPSAYAPTGEQADAIADELEDRDDDDA